MQKLANQGAAWGSCVFWVLSSLLRAQVISLVNEAPIKKPIILSYGEKEGAEQLDFKLQGYTLHQKTHEEKTFLEIGCGEIKTTKQGWAELPYFHHAIELKEHQHTHVTIKEITYEDKDLPYPLLPSRGVILRSDKKSIIPYTISKNAANGKYYPESPFYLSHPFQIRERSGINVYFYPFQYNASRQTLRVATHIQLQVTYVPEEKQPFVEEKSREPRLADMEALYDAVFVHREKKDDRWKHEITEVGDMLVITTPRDRTAIEPYVQWKREKGIRVEVLELPKGTYPKPAIQKAYRANKRLLYVQLVGDFEDLPAKIGTSQKVPMDPDLACVAGKDHYPDLIIGRFSAKNPEQITAQVNKCIQYEKYPERDGTWYRSALLMASSETDADDHETDITHVQKIANTRLKPLGFKQFFEVYGDQSPEQLPVDAWNEGVSVVNYCGHGEPTQFMTTHFDVAKANALHNGNRLPVVCAVACSVGDFQEECLAEALLRNPHGGAVGAWLASNSQAWYPPYRGQDYFNDLLAGGHRYGANQSGINTDHGYSTLGAMTTNAGILTYAQSHKTEDLETLQAWTLFGDASLQVRTAPPKEVSLSHEGCQASSFITQVHVDGKPAQGICISLSQGHLVFSALSDPQGNVTLTHTLTGKVKLAVTGQNCIPLLRELTLP